MSRQNLLTVVLSVVLSVMASTIANLAFDRQREPVLPDVIRAKRVELIDPQGRIRGLFELRGDDAHGVLPRLAMRNTDGQDAIEMGLDQNGYGVMNFASEYLNEGAVVLGHLGSPALPGATDGYEESTWGLLVTSPHRKQTGIGFTNSGKPIVPISGDTKP